MTDFANFKDWRVTYTHHNTAGTNADGSEHPEEGPVTATVDILAESAEEAEAQARGALESNEAFELVSVEAVTE